MKRLCCLLGIVCLLVWRSETRAETAVVSASASTGTATPYLGNGGDLYTGECTFSDRILTETIEASIRHREGVATGFLQMRRGDVAGAYKTFEEVLKARKDSVVALTSLAEICYQDNLLRAQGFIEEAKVLAPDYYRVHLIQALIYRRQRENQKAIESLNRCLALMPSHTEARKERADYLQEQTDSPQALRQAIEDYQILQQALPQQSPFWNYLIGLCYFHLKEYERAEKTLEPLLGMSSGKQAAYWIGRCRQELGDYEGALRYLAQVRGNPHAQESIAKIALEQANSSTGEARLRYLNHYLDGISQLLQIPAYSRHPKNFLDAGKASLEVRRVNDAVNYLKRYRELAPEDADVRPFLLHAMVLKGDPAEETDVKDLYEDFLSSHSATETVPIRLDYTSYLFTLARWSDARDELDALSKLLPQDGMPVLLQSRAAFHSGSYAEAIDFANRALELSPEKSDEIQVLIGHALLRSGSFVEAAATFDKAAIASSEDYKALRFFEIGEIYRNENHPREGIASWEKALELSPTNHTLRLAVGRAYLRSGSLESAAGSFARVFGEAEEPATRSEAETLLAYICTVQGTTKEAEERYRKAIDLWPQNYVAHTFLGHLLSDQERYEEARESFEKAVSHSPVEDATLLVQLGITCDKLNDVAGAEQAAVRAMEVAPDYAEGYNFLGYLYAERGIKLDRAVEYIEKAMQLQPNDPNITDSLGWAFYQKGETQQAIEYLEKAVSLLAEKDRYGSSVILEHLGDAYHKAGRIEDSRKMWQKAAEGLPNSETAREKLSSLSSESDTK